MRLSRRPFLPPLAGPRTRGDVPGLRLTLICIAALMPLQALFAAQGPQRLTLQCAVFYTPERQIWQRRIEVMHDARRVLSLRIDGQQAYSFSTEGQIVFTSMDNERIRIDLAQGLWRSDFRGLALGEGPCSASP